MQLTYIHHSGFLLETTVCTMLFDFVEGTLPALPAGKPLYVFVSHTHPDHYTKKIFDVADAAARDHVPQVTFVLSDDVPENDVPSALHDHTHFLKPHDTWKDALLQVETLVSNDTGVAFVISVHGEKSSGTKGQDLQIYFAGDLNAWNWDGDEEDMALIRIYHEELARIKGQHFDIAFIPLDPRLGDEMIQGITDFFDTCGCDATVVVPMHCWGQYDIIQKARAMSDRYPYMERVLAIEKEGDTFPLF